MPQIKKVVGIDLGTTYSAVAHINAYGTPEIIPNAENERITPSVILFDGLNAVVGSVAQQNAVAEPEKIVDFVKREMGRSKAAFHREFGGKQYSAAELSALILKKLKNDAEKYLKQPVTDAVITVPAHFNDAERTATMQAGQLAGLNVLQVINEPTAAALAYGVDKGPKDETVFVFDLGGGTFDVTIMRTEKSHLTMLASNGDHRLGGKDWDDIILHLVAEEFDKQHRDNPLLDLQSYQALQSRAVTAKVQLSSRTSTTIVHSYNGKSLRLVLTQTEFEEHARPLRERCKAICEIVMREAGLQWSQIDRVLLTGGSTRIPSIRQMISEMAPGIPLDDSLNPDEAVAFGAAIQGMLMRLSDEPDEPNFAEEEKISSIVRVQFSNTAGELIRVTDATTHTLGVVLWDHKRSEEYVHPMIPKGSPIPAQAEDSFGLVRPEMTKVSVRVVEGESTLPADCALLGTCEISLPPGLPRGAPVKLMYSYDRSQVLGVLVEAAGRQSRATIARSTGLNDAEMEDAAADLFKIQVV